MALSITLAWTNKWQISAEEIPSRCSRNLHDIKSRPITTPNTQPSYSEYNASVEDPRAGRPPTYVSRKVLTLNLSIIPIYNLSSTDSKRHSLYASFHINMLKQSLSNKIVFLTLVNFHLSFITVFFVDIDFMASSGFLSNHDK